MLPLVWAYIYSSKTIDESGIRENPVKAGTARGCGSEVYSIASPLHPAGARKSVHPWSRDGPAFYNLPSVPRADINHHPAATAVATSSEWVVATKILVSRTLGYRSGVTGSLRRHQRRIWVILVLHTECDPPITNTGSCYTEHHDL